MKVLPSICLKNMPSKSKRLFLGNKNEKWLTSWNRTFCSPVESRQSERPRGYITRDSKGFTLLEMMVSVSIFTIVMTISIGAILTLNDSLQKAKLMRAAVENVSFALEGMAKKIRTGTILHCSDSEDYESIPLDCPAGGGRIYFYYPEQDESISYRLSSRNSIEVEEIKTQGGIKSNGDITGSDVSVTSLKFYVSGSCPVTSGLSPSCQSSDYRQPLIKITLTGKANIPGKTRFDTTFNLQTTVSTRILDKS